MYQVILYGVALVVFVLGLLFNAGCTRTHTSRVYEEASYGRRPTEYDYTRYYAGRKGNK